MDEGQENFEAAIHKPLGGERFALGKAANDAPKAGMGAETAATPVSVKIETGVSLRQIPFPGDARMPLPLTDAELAMLHALAAPIDSAAVRSFSRP